MDQAATATPDPRAMAPIMLIAGPSLQDPTFAHTVILLVESGPSGAYGMVVNKPAPVDLATLLDGAGIPRSVAPPRTVWLGGPVQPEAGLVLYLDEPDLEPFEPQSDVLPGVRMSSSMSLLHAIAAGRGPHTFALYLGRASWAAGQLEAELAAGVWLPSEPDVSLLFDVDTDACWRRALQLLGTDPAHIAPVAAEA